jgi:hypothetical protein
MAKAQGETMAERRSSGRATCESRVAGARVLILLWWGSVFVPSAPPVHSQHLSCFSTGQVIIEALSVDSIFAHSPSGVPSHQLWMAFENVTNSCEKGIGRIGMYVSLDAEPRWYADVTEVIDDTKFEYSDPRLLGLPVGFGLSYTDEGPSKVPHFVHLQPARWPLFVIHENAFVWTWPEDGSLLQSGTWIEPSVEPTSVLDLAGFYSCSCKQASTRDDGECEVDCGIRLMIDGTVMWEGVCHSDCWPATLKLPVAFAYALPDCEFRCAPLPRLRLGDAGTLLRGETEEGEGQGAGATRLEVAAPGLPDGVHHMSVALTAGNGREISAREAVSFSIVRATSCPGRPRPAVATAPSEEEHGEQGEQEEQGGQGEQEEEQGGQEQGEGGAAGSPRGSLHTSDTDQTVGTHTLPLPAPAGGRAAATDADDSVGVSPWREALARYAEAHERSRASQRWCRPEEGPDEWRAGECLRALIYTCPVGAGGQPLHSCGGLADRLKGITSLFILALVSSRSLFIDWRTPVPLEDILLPATIDWRITGVPLLLRPRAAAGAAAVAAKGGGGRQAQAAPEALHAGGAPDPAQPPRLFGGEVHLDWLMMMPDAAGVQRFVERLLVGDRSSSPVLAVMINQVSRRVAYYSSILWSVGD